ncbi:MAG: chorismate-binding protein [Alphaproteobacteria bacterium]|nr:chorismate-binding protein [Alphaproteobacteria bacterium]
MNATWTLPSGLGLRCSERAVPAAASLDALIAALGDRRGVLLRCNFVHPGRYLPSWIGFVDPPLEVALGGDAWRFRALNARGVPLLRALRRWLAKSPALAGLHDVDGGFAARNGQGDPFDVLKAIAAALRCPDRHWGLFGPLGFDLVHGVLGIERRRPRPADQRDLVLYVPDRLVVAESALGDRAVELSYEFALDGTDTAGVPREDTPVDATPAQAAAAPPDEPAGAYAALVRAAVAACARGELFEVVLGQVFRRRSAAGADRLFRLLDRINPSPYEFLANLGGEALVGASPEMFVRVEGHRVESCPISGTIRRGADALADHDKAMELLRSDKAAAELTMCTDIDRNDKAGICEPGSVRVIGRRQIETYSHLLHTVDHVEGVLRPDRDGIDALRAHVWAVTLTGAPRRAAIAFIEAAEAEPRRWYGGAIGRIGCDGRIDTGIVLRTIRLADGVAEIRSGATILHSSVPDDEEQETRLKAQALLRAIEQANAPEAPPTLRATAAAALRRRRRVAMPDLGAPFAALLAAMAAEAGADAETGPDLALSPAPVLLAPAPDDAALERAALLAAEAFRAGRPLFGIGHGCLAVARASGCTLAPAPRPMHGDRVTAHPVEPSSWLVREIDGPFAVGCYHRLTIAGLGASSLAPVLRDADATILAIADPRQPVGGVLFQPESLLTRHGVLLVRNFLEAAERA